MTSPGFYDRNLITICDRNFTPLGVLRDWDSLEMVDRYCDVGAGKVNCSGSGWNRDLVKAGSTVIVRDASGIAQAGPLEFGEDIGDSVVMKLNWKDCNVYLDRALAYAAPGVAAEGLLPHPSDDRLGATTSVIWAYVDVNIGPDALPERRLPGLVMGADPAKGVVLTTAVQARFDNLLTLCRQLATTGAVHFWFDTVDRRHVFNVRQVRDLSDSVVFSMQTHNMMSASWAINAPTATVVVVGGAGDGAERVYSTVQSLDARTEEALWGRVEYFRDDRSADPATLQAGALRELSERSSTITAQFTPSQNQNLIYKRDYDLGDLVTGVLRPGLSVVKPIREVTTSVSVSGGRKVVPVAGDYTAGSSTGAQIQARRLVDTVAALKRMR